MINRNRIVDTFLELVKIDSLSLKERQMADRLILKIKDLGYECYEDNAGEVIGGNAGNLIIPIKGNIPNAPALLFMAHMDTVVPGLGKEGVVEGDIIRSRGDTVLGGDDLSGVVSILELLHNIKEESLSHGDIWVVFSVAEEGGLFGAHNLDYSKIHADYAFIADDEGPIGRAAVQAPYYNRLRFTLKGRAAHAGIEPEKGISAIYMASKAIASMPWFGRIDNESSCNIGIINGGKARNIVCETVILEGEVRSVSGKKMDEYTNEIVQHFRKTAQLMGGEIDAQVDCMYTGYRLTEEDPICQLFAKSASDVGLPVSFHATGGGSDTNVVNQHGIPALDISCGMTNVHSTEEQIKISDLEKISSLMIAITKRVATMDKTGTAI